MMISKNVFCGATSPRRLVGIFANPCGSSYWVLNSIYIYISFSLSLQRTCSSFLLFLFWLAIGCSNLLVLLGSLLLLICCFSSSLGFTPATITLGQGEENMSSLGRPTLIVAARKSAWASVCWKLDVATREQQESYCYCCCCCC